MKINSYNYQWLTGFDADSSCAYEDLTYPSISQHWQATQQRGELLGISALVADKIVGLAIAELDAETAKAKILSLFVVSEFRSRGIGTHLIQQLETKLVVMGCTEVELSYQATDIVQAALEPILRSQGWKPPNISLVLAKAETEFVSQLPWLNRYTVSEDFTIFPWYDLTETEKQQLQHTQQEKLWHQQGLSPFTDQANIEMINSLGLRYRGEVVGWMVTHRVAPDAIRYTSMFVEKRWQCLGRGIVLIAEAIQRQLNSSVPYYTFAVSTSNQPMLEFVARRLKPYITWAGTSKKTSKCLVL